MSMKAAEIRKVIANIKIKVPEGVVTPHGATRQSCERRTGCVVEVLSCE